MSGRIWITVAAILGAFSVVAGWYGAHKLPKAESLAVPVQIFNTGQLYQALHALALLGVGLVLLVSEGRRSDFATWLLQIAAGAFAIGIICFSGGIYVQLAAGFTSLGGVVPFGGSALLIGWVALAIGALGLQK